jgi:hypothetical protein
MSIFSTMVENSTTMLKQYVLLKNMDAQLDIS